MEPDHISEAWFNLANIRIQVLAIQMARPEHKPVSPQLERLAEIAKGSTEAKARSRRLLEDAKRLLVGAR